MQSTNLSDNLCPCWPPHRHCILHCFWHGAINPISYQIKIHLFIRRRKFDFTGGNRIRDLPLFGQTPCHYRPTGFRTPVAHVNIKCHAISALMTNGNFSGLGQWTLSDGCFSLGANSTNSVRHRDAAYLWVNSQ